MSLFFNVFLTILCVSTALALPRPAAAALAKSTLPTGDVNLQNKMFSDRMADQIIEKYKAESKKTGTPISELEKVVVRHSGYTIPEHLERILIRLDNASVPVELHRVSERDLQEHLKTSASSKTSDATHVHWDVVEEPLPPVGKTSHFVDRAKLVFRNMMGMPDGVSTSIEDERHLPAKYTEASIASLAGSISGTAVAFTFYTQDLGTTLESARAGIAMTAWVWGLNFKGPVVSRLLAQSKVLKETDRDVYSVSNRLLPTLAGNLLLTTATNAVLVISAYGVDHLEQYFKIAAVNIAMTILGRTPVDQWFSERRPTVQPDGDFVQDKTKGQMSPEMWLLSRSTWSLLMSFGLLPALADGNLLPQQIFATVGASAMVYSYRHGIRRKWEEFITKLKRKQVIETCESLVVLNSDAAVKKPGGSSK